MRGLMFLCFVAAVSAGALPYGYEYSSPQYTAPAASIHIPSITSASHGAHGLGSLGLGHGSGSGSYAGGQITKNFFIHSAPEDSDEDIINDSKSAGPSNKKYNVVFVKAPVPSAKAAALALRKAQSEEKTLIYVLNKKLDASDLQAALAGTPTEPTKPQVVFIKYKTPEEAEHAQHQIQSQYEALGGGPSFVSDEGISPISSVIGSLGSAPRHVNRLNNQYLPQQF